jgi:hypothetical protein
VSKEIAQALLAPFEEKDLKHRPGRAGMTFTYADARAVAQRLDDHHPTGLRLPQLCPGRRAAEVSGQ